VGVVTELVSYLSFQLDKIAGDEVEGGVGRLGDASGAELQGAGDVGGLQAVLSGGAKIVCVGGDHHHLFGVEVEEVGGQQVGFGVGFVEADELGGEDQVPGEPRPLCQVDEEGDLPFERGAMT
jgi:hypothetical protein